MNLPFRIARRYLFAKKSTNAINIISGISVFGISLGTAALVLILSVFNGFEDLITGLFGAFNPDVKVTPVKGKTFPIDSAVLGEIKEIDGVDFVSCTLEEIAFFEYDDIQDFGRIKGVDDNYRKVVGIDSTIIEGRFDVKQGERYQAVLGSGMRNKLAVNVYNEFNSMRVYMPKRKKTGPLSKPYKSRLVQPVGTFFIQQEFDQEYVLASLEFVADLLDLDNEASALEIKLSSESDPELVQKRIKEILGPDFLVRDRYQQDEAFLKLMNIEKWMAFAILSFTLILVAFNLVGSLWMIVLDKKPDVAILKSMGATKKTIRNIFLQEGLLLCLLGLIIGFTMALLFYGGQKIFGIVPIPAGFIIDAYPISIRFPDFAVVALAVFLIGLLASLPAAHRATKISALIRNE